MQDHIWTESTVQSCRTFVRFRTHLCQGLQSPRSVKGMVRAMRNDFNSILGNIFRLSIGGCMIKKQFDHVCSDTTQGGALSALGYMRKNLRDSAAFDLSSHAVYLLNSHSSSTSLVHIYKNPQKRSKRSNCLTGEVPKNIHGSFFQTNDF